MSRPWLIGASFVAGLLLQSSCGGSPPEVVTPELTPTCDGARVAAGYLAAIDVDFTPAQLIEPSSTGTWIGVLRVGETAHLTVSADQVFDTGSRYTTIDCSHLVSGVTWGTSDSSVAEARSTGRNAALLAGLSPGEFTVPAQASFPTGTAAVPYMFASGSRVRAVRVVP